MEVIQHRDAEIPPVGLGTWQMDKQTAYEAVSTAVELGYRHIDTAQAYHNEQGVGKAIQDANIDRDEIFLTTKVYPGNRSVSDIVTSVEASLERLQTNYVDLLLIHWPHPLANLETVMKGLNEVHDRDWTRYIGVSNFGKDRLKRAQNISDVPIFTNQVLFHPWWPQRDLLRYCQTESILLTAYSPLANGYAVDDTLLAEIGEKYNKSSAQVTIRWVIQHENVVTIPMSTLRSHLKTGIAMLRSQFNYRLFG
ncbi:MAG: aldo/keto reductase [Halobacteriaceae archaeon]